MPGPGQMLVACRECEDRARRRAGAATSARHRPSPRPAATRKRRRSSGIAHRRREADAPRSRGARRAAARDRATEDRRASTPAMRVQFVENDAAQRREQSRASALASSSASCSGVVSRMSGGVAALALALRGRRVAGARLDADGKPHLGDRDFEIARDVDGQRFQRRDVERVQRARGAAPRSARSTSDGRNPASVLPAPVGAISSALAARAARAGRADARAAPAARGKPGEETRRKLEVRTSQKAPEIQVDLAQFEPIGSPAVHYQFRDEVPYMGAKAAGSL